MKQLSIFALAFLVGMFWMGCDSDSDTPSGPALNAPSDLIATAISDATINLMWKDNSEYETGFRVFRSFDGVDWEQIVELPARSTVYSDRELAEGIVHHYRVLAFSPVRLSEFSNVSYAQTLPKAPSGLSGERLSGTSVSLSWVDNSEKEDGFEIQRKRSTQSDAAYRVIAELEANTTEFVDTELTNNTTYVYRVRTTLGEINSGWSNTTNIRTTVFTPNAPVNLTGEVLSANSILLNWTDNATNELGFVIESQVSNTNQWRADSINQPNVRMFLLEGLSALTEYEMRVFAYNDSGNSDYSNTITIETPSGPPAAPSNLQATAQTHNRVRLNWVDNANDEEEYYIERAEPDINYTRIATLGPNGTTYVDSTVIRLKTYYYRVAAANERGRSAWSNIATATTPDGPPQGPSQLRATTTGVDQVTLTWIRRSGNEDGFRIERRNVNQEHFETIGVVERAVVNFVDSGLTPETWYAYRVFAFNALAESEPSNIDSAKTWSLQIFADGFEEYELNVPPPDPPYATNSDGLSWARVTNIEPYSGSQSLHFNDSSNDDESFAQTILTLPRGLDKGRISFWANLADNGHFGIIGADQSANHYITYQIQFNNDNSLFFRDGGALTRSEHNFPTNQWFKITIDMDTRAANYQVFFDDEPVTEVLRMQRNDHRTNLWLVFLCFSDASIRHVYIDDIDVSETPPANNLLSVPAGDFHNGTERVKDLIYKLD